MNLFYTFTIKKKIQHLLYMVINLTSVFIYKK